MTETNQPNQEQVRQLIRIWLTAQSRSLRNLAQEAGIQPSVLSRFLKGETTLEASSALKLYSVMQQTMNFPDRKSFIETMDLLPLARAFGRDPLFTIDLQAPPYEVGSRLMVAGFDLARQTLYADALPVFRKAEEVFGKGSSQAAYVVCIVAQLYLMLGDYQQAQAEVTRAQDMYSTIMDPETKAEWFRLRHWIDYYLGNYEQSEHWVQERLKIAEEAGLERLKNLHFLGRIYYDRGCLAAGQQEARELFRQAERCFEQSYQMHLKWGDEHNRAFDLFRKAQALQMLHYWDDAKKLRARASQLFTDGSRGGPVALLHIKLEEAKLLLENGAIAVPKRKAEEVLQGWAQVQYPKGVGDALHVLGNLAYMQGTLDQALEIFVARLCVYPYDHYPSTRQVWADVAHLQREITRREGQKFYQARVQQLLTLLEHRHGYFAYLDQLAADPRSELIYVIKRLQSPLP